MKVAMETFDDAPPQSQTPPCYQNQTPPRASPLLGLRAGLHRAMRDKRILHVDGKALLIWAECLIMCLLQDEVAHTVTESRVLQNTRHPFLTVRTLVASTAACGQTSPARWLSVLGHQSTALNPP